MKRRNYELIMKVILIIILILIGLYIDSTKTEGMTKEEPTPAASSLFSVIKETKELPLSQPELVIDILDIKIEPAAPVQSEEWISLPVYTNGTFKSYMDGKAITNKSSAAYKQLQKMEIVDGLYTEGRYVGIAIASYYGEAGDKFRITLSSGQVFYAVKTDTKAAHQLDSNYAHPDGSIIEFIVDTKTLNKTAKLMGSLDCIYTGTIEKIERLVN